MHFFCPNSQIMSFKSFVLSSKTNKIDGTILEMKDNYDTITNIVLKNLKR